MFSAIISVLSNIANDHSVTRYSRGDAGGALKIIVTFDFVFILLMMEMIMKITDALCQTLQKKDIDIINAIHCVSNTKQLLRDLRNDGWEPLLTEVKKICEKNEIDIPDLNLKYVDVTKSRNKHDNTTTLHHYKIDVFNVAVDQQLAELEDRFNSQATELSLCASLAPRVDTFNVSDISTLVEKYYPADFSDQERDQLECQLPHFQLDVCNIPELSTVASLADMIEGLVKLGKDSFYPMVDILLRLVVTLPVSTATVERIFSAVKLCKTRPRKRIFSAVKLCKTRPRNKMGDDYLIYVEKELAAKISSLDILKAFDLGGPHRGNFKLIEI